LQILARRSSRIDVAAAAMSERGQFRSVRVHPLAAEGPGGDRLWRGFPMSVDFDDGL